MAYSGNWPPADGYPATVLDVHDGDTYTAQLDLGFNVATTIKVRIAGINAPELKDPGGADARAFLAQTLVPITATEPDIHIISHHHEQSFNRWVCDTTVDGHDLATLIVEAGHAQRNT